MRTSTHALTYEDKIPLVVSGECRQTIRFHPEEKKREKRPGDKIILHTWAGDPYRSKWGWTKEFTITDVAQIIIERGTETPMIWQVPGVPVIPSSSLDGSYEHMRLLSKAEIELMAYLDGINPPTAEALISVLTGLNPDNLYGRLLDVVRFE